MMKKKRVSSIINCVIGGMFLLPVLICAASDVDLETKVLVALKLGIAAILFLDIGIFTYNMEVGSKVKRYRKVFSQNKPEKVNYKIARKDMMGKKITYFIEFWVDESFCCEFVKLKEVKKSENSQCYIKVIYNRHNEFKDFEVYMDKEKLNDIL